MDISVANNYYFTDPKDYLMWIYANKPAKQKTLIEDFEKHIDNKLKDPKYKEKVLIAMEAENRKRKKVKQEAVKAIPEDIRNEQVLNWQNSAKLDREENPEKYKQIAADVADKNRERGHYKRNGDAWREKRMQETPEERSARSKYANEFITPEIREQIRLSCIKTYAKNKLDNFTKNYYDVIQEEGWFTREEAHAKYQFKGRTRGTVLGSQMLGIAFDECVELGLFESKCMNVVLLNGGARRMHYTKVVEGKDIDYKSLEDKVNSDNDKVRALRLTDKDYLAKKAKSKLKKEKEKEEKNKKAIKKLKTLLPKEFTNKEAIEAAVKIGLTVAWAYCIIRDLDFCIKTYTPINRSSNQNRSSQAKYSWL